MKMVYEDTPVPAGTVLVFIPNDSTGTSFVGTKATVTKEFTGGYSIEVRVSDSHGGFIEESPVMGRSGALPVRFSGSRRK